MIYYALGTIAVVAALVALWFLHEAIKDLEAWRDDKF